MRKHPQSNIPFQIIHQTPTKTPHHNHPIGNRNQNPIDIIIIIRAPHKIAEDILFQCPELLKGLREPELGDGDAARGFPRILHVPQQRGHPVGGLVQPGGAGVGGGPDEPAALGLGVRVRGVVALGVEGVGGVGDAAGDAVVGRKVKLGCVGVVGKDVGAIEDGGFLVGREVGQEGGDVGFERGGVVAG